MSLTPHTAQGPYRTVEEELDRFFQQRPDQPQAGYSDTHILEISSLLRNSEHPSWSQVPRIYVVLRTIGQLQLLDEFIDQGITDIWLPFSVESLPTKLSPSARIQFLECQS